MALLKFLAALSCLVTLACQRPPTVVELSDRDVIVHSILRGGADSVTVLVTRANLQSFQQPRPVTDAAVRLITPEHTIVLVAGGDCLRSNHSSGEVVSFAGCYVAAVPGGVQNGEQYHLEITVPGHPLITGTTVVPSNLELITPVIGEEIIPAQGVQADGEPFAVAWTGVPPQRTAYLQLIPDSEACSMLLREADDHSIGTPILLPAPGIDSLSVRAFLFDCAQATGQLPGRFVVSMFDDNYQRYLSNLDEALRPDEASIGITGAFGVFGSAAVASRPVVLMLD